MSETQNHQETPPSEAPQSEAGKPEGSKEAGKNAAPKNAAAPVKRVQPEIKAPAAKPNPIPAGMQGQMAAPRNRHDLEFRHDVFVSDVKHCIRNVSYKEFVLERVDVEHKHVYHSHSNTGKKLNRTGGACGHWHYVEHYVDPVTGATVAKCGPAMHEVTELARSGKTFTKVQPVYFEEEIANGDDAGQIRKVVDNHTHVLEYQGSEELSPMGIQNGLKEQRALANAMGISIDPAAVKDNTPAPMSPADGATIA